MSDRLGEVRQHLDRFSPTMDLWAEATRRASEPVTVDRVDPGRGGRRFVIAAAVIAGAFVGVGALVGQRDGDRATRQTTAATFPSRVEVPPVGDARSAQLRDGTPVWVVNHEDGSVSVLDAASAHRPFGFGALVGWCASSRGFEDPVHGSQYDEQGRYRGGPAPTGLRAYATGGVENGSVTVTGADPFPSDRVQGDLAVGPACSDGSPDLEPHLLASAPGITLREALDRSSGEMVVIANAPILVVAGQPTLVCSGEVRESAPPTCDGVEAPGHRLESGQRWAVVTGTFVGRIIDNTVQDIIFTHGWKLDPDLSTATTRRP